MIRLPRTAAAVLGLLLAAPAITFAEPPSGDPAAPAINPSRAARWSMFRRPHLCSDCQRAELQAKGIHVPPPPALPPGVPVRAESCDRCGGRGVGAVTTMPFNSPGTAMAGPAAAAPGYAVVGAPAAPGYAVVGGALPVEPTPIGRMAAYGREKAARPNAGRPASGDAEVSPSSFAAPAPMSVGHNHPNVIGHGLGLTALGRSGRQARARRREEAHARIPYGPTTKEPVTDLPASVVYRVGR